MKILGIDPGANMGMALFEGKKLTRVWTIHPLRLDFELLHIVDLGRVIFEDSRLQSVVFNRKAGAPAMLKIARNVGEIDAWCRLIVALCEARAIAAHSISPKSKGAKLNAAQFKELTGYEGQTNQHERDAALVAWPYRGVAT